MAFSATLNNSTKKKLIHVHLFIVAHSEEGGLGVSDLDNNTEILASKDYQLDKVYAIEPP